MSGVNENLKTLFSKMEEFVSTKTVVGEAVQYGNVTIVPLIDVTFGMGTGLADTSSEEKKSAGAGGGAVGAKMTPSAVLVITDGTVQLVNVKSQESVSKLIDMVPGILAKLGISAIFDKKDKKDKKDD